MKKTSLLGSATPMAKDAEIKWVRPGVLDWDTVLTICTDALFRERSTQRQDFDRLRALVAAGRANSPDGFRLDADGHIITDGFIGFRLKNEIKYRDTISAMMGGGMIGDVLGVSVLTTTRPDKRQRH